MSSFSNFAARGAAEFDRLRPGWARRVNTNLLDMGSIDLCVGAQVFGTYHDTLKALDIRNDEAHLYGFDAGHGNPEDLTEAWLFEIGKRRW